MPVSESGVLLIGLGGLICVLAWWRLAVHRARRRAARRVVVVPALGATHAFDHALRELDPPDPAAPVHQMRLRDSDPPLAVNLDDELLVRPDPDMPGNALLCAPFGGVLAKGYLGYGVLCVALGALALFGASGAGSAPELVLVSGGLGTVGMLGLTQLGWLLRELPGSQRVFGTVMDVHVVGTGQKPVYRPLVEYVLDGRQRRVWGSPRWFKPALGRGLDVRIGRRAPRDAVSTTPFILASTLFLTLLWLLGVLGMIDAAVLAFLA